jgi:hypothetical protein
MREGVKHLEAIIQCGRNRAKNSSRNRLHFIPANAKKHTEQREILFTHVFRLSWTI